jgi:hypothetical protein
VDIANRGIRRIRAGKHSTIADPAKTGDEAADLKNSIMTVAGVMANRGICPRAWGIMM